MSSPLRAPWRRGLQPQEWFKGVVECRSDSPLNRSHLSRFGSRSHCCCCCGCYCCWRCSTTKESKTFHSSEAYCCSPVAITPNPSTEYIGLLTCSTFRLPLLPTEVASRPLLFVRLRAAGRSVGALLQGRRSEGRTPDVASAEAVADHKGYISPRHLREGTAGLQWLCTARLALPSRFLMASSMAVGVNGINFRRSTTCSPFNNVMGLDLSSSRTNLSMTLFLNVYLKRILSCYIALYCFCSYWFPWLIVFLTL